MKTTFFKISILLLGFLTVFISCQDEETNNETTKTKLLGTWIETKPYYDGICDTIEFKSDNTIDLYYPFEGYV